MASRDVILYDGDCGLCQRSTQYVLKRDPDAVFRYAPLKSKFADTVAARHPEVATDFKTLSSFVVVANAEMPEERILLRATAVGYVMAQLPSTRFLSALLTITPLPLLNLGYSLVARNRTRIFGPADACRIPSAAEKTRFIED